MTMPYDSSLAFCYFYACPGAFIQPTVRGGRAVPAAVDADGGAQRQDPDLQATGVSVTHTTWVSTAVYDCSLISQRFISNILKRILPIGRLLVVSPVDVTSLTWCLGLKGGCVRVYGAA